MEGKLGGRPGRWGRAAVVVLELLVVAIAAGGWLRAARALDGRDRLIRQQHEALQATSRMVALGPTVKGSRDEEGGLQGRMEDLDRRIEALEEQDSTSEPDPSEVAAIVLRSVFTVQAGRTLGSAFAAQVDGRGVVLVTNYHVVAAVWEHGSEHVMIRRDDETFAGRILQVSQADDLAAIRVGQPFTTIARATGTPAVGEEILAVGSPFGLGGTVTSGIVSASREGFIQFSAPVGPGNSGGPVVDMQGRVVGVIFVKVVDEAAEGLAFAIPMSTVCQTVISC